MWQAEFVDGNQAERARREGIAQYLTDFGCNARRAASLFREHEIAFACLTQIGNHRFAPFTLVNRAQPPTIPIPRDHAENEFLTARELLHWMRDIARAALFSPRKNAVANAKRTTFAALHHADARRGLAFGFPMFGHGVNAIPFDIDDAQHRDFRHAAHLVEGATGGGVYKPLVGHILE